MSDEHDQADATGSDYSVDARFARAGSITYLHIAAADARRAAAFYREVFGWHINDPDSDRPSFDDPGGHLSGAWIGEHPARSESGLLPYIYVDDIEEMVSRIVAHGGEIVTEPFPEGLLSVATFRDPAGNMLGLWHDTTRQAATLLQDPDQHPEAEPQSLQGIVPASIQPELWVKQAGAAVAFYRSAFGAVVMHQVGAGDDVVAQLNVDGAVFWVTEANPSMKRLSPRAIDGATGRTLLVVADPEHFLHRALDAGATEVSPVSDEHGWRLGRIVDPFGHEWEIGRPLGSWPPA